MNNRLNGSARSRAAAAATRAEEARKRFVKSVRPARLEFKLGVREIRMMGRQPWLDTGWTNTFAAMQTEMPEDVAAFNRLYSKGLLSHDVSERITLTEIGECTRRLLVLSELIEDVEDEEE